MVDADELSKIMPALPHAKRDQYLPFLQAAMAENDITGRLREAAFLAQLAHESVQLRFMEEIASGVRYEGRKDLGNTQPGDGRRYKGRGPIQLTGRANYRKYGHLLHLDLEDNPQQASTPQVGFRIAGMFWKLHGLNALADQRRFVAITRAINGGTNGLADRLHFYRIALAALSDGDPNVLDAITEDDRNVRVVVNGEPVELDGDKTPGFLKDGHAWGPLRPLATVLGLEIAAIDDNEATISKNGKTFKLPSEILGDRGYVPVRELVVPLGLSCDWIPEELTVKVGQP